MTLPMPVDLPEPVRFRVYTLTPLAVDVLALLDETTSAVYTPRVAWLTDRYRVTVMLGAVRRAAASATAAHRARTAPIG